MWDRATSTDVGSGTFCRTMSDARTLEATRRRPHADAPSLPRSEVGVLIISISTKTIVDRLLFFRNKNLPPPINIFDCHEFGQDHDIKQKILLFFSALSSSKRRPFIRGREGRVQLTFTVS